MLNGEERVKINRFLEFVYGIGPVGAAFDSANGYIYVTNVNSNNVSVINGSTNKVVASIGVGSIPFGAAFDSANGYIYVTHNDSTSVSVINGSTNKVIASIGVGSGPVGAAFDSANGYIYVTNVGSGTVSIISTSSQVMKQYSVTFTETGLPSNTLWYVNLTNGSSFSSTTSTISLSEINGNYSYSVSTANKTYKPTSYTNSFTIDNSSVSESITFTTVPYNVKFTESGLPSGITWYVNLTSGVLNHNITPGVIIFTLTNGTYSYSATSTDNQYRAEMPATSFTVNGHNMTISVDFTNKIYNVTFKESGLPPGSNWYVNLSNGLTTGQVSSYVTSFDLTNGTYSFAVFSLNANYSANPASGSFTVNGKNVTVTITFRLTLYKATFTESGLPSGTQWNLSFMGRSYYLTNNTHSFLLGDGTYHYSVAQIHGYTLDTPEVFTISGSNVSVFVQFIKNATLHIHVNPISSIFTLNGITFVLSNGYANLSVTPGYYFVNASETGYYAFTNLYNFKSGSYSINISLKSLVVYGELKGVVFPGNTIISANGILIAVSNGTFEQDLSPGTYIVSASANGYISKDYEINITQNQETFINITLTKSSRSYTIEGYVNPANSSVMFGSYMAYVNSTGYFEISLPMGNYSASVTAYGYFPDTGTIYLKSNMVLYFNLTKEPAPTSVASTSNITASGYNVTVSNLTYGNNNLSLNYNASPNGTVTVVLPYSEIKNVSISDIMNSTVYVNGAAYKNFTVALSASNGTFSAILTVYGLNGDPVLIWAYSPSFVLHKPNNTSGLNIPYFEIGSILGILIIVVATVSYIRRKKR